MSNPSSIARWASIIPKLNAREIVIHGLPIALLVIFSVTSSPYAIGLLAKFLTYAMLALTLDILWGYAGILSFAHAVFFGLGSYSLALTLTHFGDVPGITYVGFVLSALVPGLLALVVGYMMFSRRVSGVYFAIVTFALGAILQSVTIVWIDFTGGLNGLYGFTAPKLGLPYVWEFEITTNNLSAYYVISIALIIVYFLLRQLVKSPFGQVVRAINNDEDRVASFGYDVSAIKLAVFVLSCALAGFSGALYVPVGFVSAKLMDILFSTSVIVWVAVGGRGTLMGAILGALAVNYLQTFMSDVLVFYWLLFVGLFFIVVVLVMPDGIVGLAKRIEGRLTGARR